jgi:ERF superfamily
MHRSSESIAALAAALAKAQMALTNPEKSLTGTLPGNRPDKPGRTFRYASLSSGLDIVRKVLGQHEIATLQTTVIDQDIQTVSLTTVLAHASGEWIASDWPVCTLSDMAAPRRMGAALTYARRYGLFTLVGIAGEDDLDAPDLAGQPAAGAPKAGNGFDRGKVNGSGVAGTFGAFARNRKPWTPPKQALAPEPSAALRDRLVGELSGLASADEATTWAQRALGAKNTLRDVDAAVVEVAFTSRMAELGEGGEASLASGSRRGSCGIDRAARPCLTHGRPARQRGGRQGSAPPCGEAQAQTAAPRAGVAVCTPSAFRSRFCTGPARGTPGEQRRPLACRQKRPSVERTATLSRPRPSGVRGVTTVSSVRTATLRRSPSEVHAAASHGAPGQRRIRRSALPHPPSGRSPARRRGRVVEVRRHRPGGDCPTAVAAHPARRGTHSRAPRSPTRSTDGPSGKRCRTRAVRRTCTPMTSWRQFQANRLNALKSTGPRTEEGKRTPRRNALRHGLTAETVIDGLEDGEDYRGFEAVIIADYDAETAVERELVLRLASLLWRLRRIIAIETDLFQIQAEILRDRRNEMTTVHGKGPEVLTLAEAGRLGCNGPALSPRELTHCFLRIGNLDGGAFERLARYNATLWKQTAQTLLLLGATRRR